MEGRAPGDLFGKDGILSELTKALAERALSTEMDVHLDEECAEEAPEGRNQPRVSDLLCMTDPVHASPKGSMNDHLERTPRRIAEGC